MSATTERIGALEPSRGARALNSVKTTAPIFLVLFALLAWISVLQPTFLEPGPFLAFLKRAAPLAILAAGQYFVIVGGGFDLSVGSLITVVVIVAARLLDGDSSGNVPVILLLLLGGGAIGFLNGTITTRLRVPSFITTLGMLLILQGAVFLWTNGSPTGALTEGFRTIGRGGIEGVPVLDQLPYSVLLLIAVGVLAVAAMRADFGRKLLAVGDNDRAAHLAGVPVARMRTITFVVSGLSAAIAGILLGGFAGVSAQVGLGLEFQAITAVVLGGVAIGGGKGSVVAAMAGALTLEALFTLLNLQGVSGALESSVQGLIIIGAVAFASLRLRGAG